MSVWKSGCREERGAVRRDTAAVPNFSVVSGSGRQRQQKSKASQYQLPVYFKWKSRRFRACLYRRGGMQMPVAKEQNRASKLARGVTKVRVEATKAK